MVNYVLRRAKQKLKRKMNITKRMNENVKHRPHIIFSFSLSDHIKSQKLFLSFCVFGVSPPGMIQSTSRYQGPIIGINRTDILLQIFLIIKYIFATQLLFCIFSDIEEQLANVAIWFFFTADGSKYLKPIPGALWKVRFWAGAFSLPPFRSQKPHIRATNDKRHLIICWKIYNFYMKHFQVRSILRSPEVIKDKMFWNKLLM